MKIPNRCDCRLIPKPRSRLATFPEAASARTLEPKEADDHDTEWQAVLVPFGILNTQSDQLSIYLGQSAETSDFIVDCLTAWWNENQHDYLDLDELVIDLDGGAATRSNRTQFIKRMVELSQAIGLKIRLIYYPPYHSKYNPIERCWAALENYWNGAILDSVEAALHWAANMTSERNCTRCPLYRSNLSNRNKGSATRVRTVPNFLAAF